MTIRPMRFSVLAIALASVLAACGGSSGGGTTAPTAAPTATPTAAPTATPTAGPTSAPATWTFGGSTATLTATNGQVPGLVTLSAYRNISATLQFGAATGSGPIAVSDATNVGDVTPNTLPADNASTATPVIYFSLYNSGTIISFGSTTPVVTLTNSGGFGTATTCVLDSYANFSGGSGGSPTWQTVDTGGTISGTTATIPSQSLPSPNTVDITGQQIVAVACK